ncbi:MAG: DNA-processing protein DprA [Betaproteobacteria bacterium]|jgi:DNA processing protein
MDLPELRSWLRLQLTPGVGNISARALLAAFGLPEEVFAQSLASLTEVVHERQARALLQWPPALDALAERTWQWLQADLAHRRVLPLGDGAYPRALLDIDDPPVLLYAMGFGPVWERGWPDVSRCVAVVGSRNPTAQGGDNALAFAQSLALEGITVVSGMALGVDAAAHRGALAGADPEGGVPTIAVVGTGLDRVYPSQHHTLAQQIAQRGVILSEYPLGTAPLAAHFPRRNRLISGLSQGTLVVEAALKSGSLITAEQALEQGRDVFAIPGSIHSTQSRGCHALIKQGAHLVESVHDILSVMDIATAAHDGPHDQTDAGGAQDLWDSDPALRDAIGFEPSSLEALHARTGRSTAQLQAELMALELQGALARLPGGLFQRGNQRTRS